MDNRSPRPAAAAGKSGCSRTLRVPWSGTITAPITLSTNGSAVRSASALTQSAGRLKVGMPTAMLAVPGAGSVAYQPPLIRLTSVSVVMSNQIQPPSSNGRRATSISTTAGCSSVPTNWRPSTEIRTPVALVR